ncbi:MAG: putative Zn-dependent protease, partial [Paraglaciecola psychrophila]
MTSRYRSLAKILPTLCLSLLIVSCGSETENTAEVVQSHLERSQAYQEQGQYRAAIIEARNIIKKDRNNNLGYLRLAQMYVELGSHRAASGLLETIPAPNAETQVLLAEAYVGQRKYTSAQKALDEYLFQGGDAEAVQYQLTNSHILASKNQLETVTEQLQAVIAQSPDNSEAKNLLTRFYLNQQQLPQAQDLLAATLASHPKDPETLMIAAQLAYLKNDLPAAEGHLTNALLELPETDIMLPQRSQVLKQLSSVMTQQGRTTEALAYTKALAKSNPEGTAAQSEFTQALKVLQEGDVQEAEKMLQKIYEDYPNNEMVALYLGLIDYQQGDFSAASELLNSNIDVETASPQIIQTTALSLLRGKQIDKALTLLEEAAAIHSDNAKLIALYGLTALQSDDSQEDGIIAIQRALAMEPELLNLRLGLARYYLSNDKPEQADAQLEQVLKTEPGHVLASNLRAAILERSGDNDGAANTIAKMLSAKPEDHLALNLAARYALSQKDLTRAQQYYQKSLQLQA